MPYVTSKYWWKSKTVWTEIIVLVLGVLELATTSTLFSPQTLAIMLSVAGALGVVLRFLTSQPISTDGEPKSVA